MTTDTDPPGEPGPTGWEDGGALREIAVELLRLAQFGRGRVALDEARLSPLGAQMIEGLLLVSGIARAGLSEAVEGTPARTGAAPARDELLRALRDLIDLADVAERRALALDLRLAALRLLADETSAD